MFTQIILPAARPVDDKIICSMRHLGKTILILNTSLLRLNTEIIFRYTSLMCAPMNEQSNVFSYTTLVVGDPFDLGCNLCATEL